MKGVSHPANDVTLNPSRSNESIRDVIGRVDSERRKFIKTGLSASALAAMGGVSTFGLLETVEAAPIPAANGFAGIGFESVPAKVQLSPAPLIGPKFSDTVDLPAGYTSRLLVAWGDPVVPTGPAWVEDATQNAAAQEKQYGMHNDGMHYFPFPLRGVPAGSSERGLLCVNHEYTHENILHGAEGLTGGSGVTIQKVRKSQAAHGVSVMELRKTGASWAVIASSTFGRRITANTPMRLSGPAAGAALLKSTRYVISDTGSTPNGAGDGIQANGTANNCAHGWTPWGTYLTCEENWNGYFGATGALPPLASEMGKNNNRYGVTAAGFGYFWHTVDPRWDVSVNPLEPNQFGWVVEIDPFDPKSVPVKRTALGRFKHESAQVAVGADYRVAFYMGDDERNEYIYKFVCAQPWNPSNRAANRDLLDSGVLYVAKFTSAAGQGANTYRGRWIPLLPGQEAEAYTATIPVNPADPEGAKRKPLLRELPDFAGATDAEVLAKILIKTRMAADAVGATMMDRPEWTALRTYASSNGNPGSAYGGTYGAGRPLELYCTLTNNNRRGSRPPATASSNNPAGTTTAGSARPLPDAANPRSDNVYGHIIRWREDNNQVQTTGFEWDLFVLAGDSASTKVAPGGLSQAPDYLGNVVDVPAGSADFGAPDGLWFDHFGRMWIQTDQQGDAGGDFNRIGANTMLAADPNTREIRRFLTSPYNCEVTGVVSTPDGKTLFCGIQHPGDDSTAADPDLNGAWPGTQYPTNSAGVAVPNGDNRRPRSSVVVITRDDGGVVGGL